MRWCALAVLGRLTRQPTYTRRLHIDAGAAAWAVRLQRWRAVGRDAKCDISTSLGGARCALFRIVVPPQLRRLALVGCALRRFPHHQTPPSSVLPARIASRRQFCGERRISTSWRLCAERARAAHLTAFQTSLHAVKTSRTRSSTLRAYRYLEAG